MEQGGMVPLRSLTGPGRPAHGRAYLHTGALVHAIVTIVRQPHPAGCAEYGVPLQLSRCAAIPNAPAVYAVLRPYPAKTARVRERSNEAIPTGSTRTDYYLWLLTTSTCVLHHLGSTEYS